jgi:hypothetical protein
MINTNNSKNRFWYRKLKRPDLEGTDGGNIVTDVISPQVGASDDKSTKPAVLPSYPPLSGKLLAYQQFLDQKNNK